MMESVCRMEVVWWHIPGLQQGTKTPAVIPWAWVFLIMPRGDPSGMYIYSYVFTNHGYAHAHQWRTNTHTHRPNLSHIPNDNLKSAEYEQRIWHTLLICSVLLPSKNLDICGDLVTNHPIKTCQSSGLRYTLLRSKIILCDCICRYINAFSHLQLFAFLINLSWCICGKQQFTMNSLL